MEEALEKPEEEETAAAEREAPYKETLAEAREQLVVPEEPKKKRGPGRPKKDRSNDPPPPPKRPVGRPRLPPEERKVRAIEPAAPPPQLTPVQLLVQALQEQKTQARAAKTAMFKSFVFR
jgi:hypothetical protein